MNVAQPIAPADWREVARPFLCGDVIPEGVRNNELVRIAGRLRWEGHDSDVIFSVLKAVNGLSCVPPLPDLQVAAIARWIARKPAGPGAGAASRRDFDHCRDSLVVLMTKFEDFAWRGSGRATDQDLVQALLLIAWRCGRLTFHASYRQLAEQAGVGLVAVTRALTKSENVRAWVRMVARGHGRKASMWRLRAPNVRRLRQPNNNKTSLRILFRGCRSTDDIWRYNGLGKTARLIFELLGDCPTTVHALADSLDRHSRTVDRNLGKLSRYGLAVKERAGWRRGAATPQEIEPSLPNFGASERQRNRHRQERERYEERLVRRMRLRTKLKLEPMEQCRSQRPDEEQSECKPLFETQMSVNASASA